MLMEQEGGSRRSSLTLLSQPELHILPRGQQYIGMRFAARKTAGQVERGKGKGRSGDRGEGGMVEREMVGRGGEESGKVYVETGGGSCLHQRRGGQERRGETATTWRRDR
eukprot:764736-Hanusia_phi.AAC.2